MNNMNVFDKINNINFFKPLCSKNREIYYGCICELLRFSGSNIAISDSDARDVINIYLQNTNLSYEVEEDNESEPIKKTGNDIMRYFRQCGWLSEKELSRNGEYETYIEPLCRSFINYLKRIAEEKDVGGLTNSIYDMYLRLQSAFAEDSLLLDRPYTKILKPLMNSMISLEEKLFELSKNISVIMKGIMEKASLNQLGEMILSDALLEKFFRDYYYIKKEGTIPILISRINEYIREIQNDEWVDKIAKEYSEIFEVSEEEAKDDIKDKIYDLKNFITYDYQERLDRIENQINGYQELLHARITLLGGNGISIENTIDNFFRTIKKLSAEERKNALERVGSCSEVIAHKYVSTRSITYKKKKKTLLQTEGLDIYEVTEEDLNVLENIKRNRYSVKNVSSFLETQCNGRNTIEIKNEIIPDRHTAQMYAAAMSLSQLKNFPFDVEITDEVIDYGFVEISNAIFRRKEG